MKDLNLLHHQARHLKEVMIMPYTVEELDELKNNCCSNVCEFEEGGYSYLFIPLLKLPPGCIPERTDALLCPQSHSGYPSRLFFLEKIQTPKTVNWNSEAFILGKLWYAFSYNNVSNMPLLHMVMNHLRGMVE
jgi:hypothetical protein